MQHIFFDLDGTIINPLTSTVNGINYALESMGHAPRPQEELACAIGPPLNETFIGILGLSAADSKAAILLFQEYFLSKGLYQNSLYPGMRDLLSQLNAVGKSLYIATARPTEIAKKMVSQSGIEAEFLQVAGSPMDHPGLPKADIIQEVLSRWEIAPESAIMVGDRKHDIIGAKKHQMPSIGVLYGYGSKQELTSAGADYFAGSTKQLAKLLF